LVYGRNPVLEALRAGRRVTRVVMLTSLRADGRVSEVLELASAQGAKLERVSRERLDDIAHSEAHQGLVAYIEPRKYLGLDELRASLRNANNPLLLVLDGIQDPNNLGSICRSAEAAGVAGVVIGSHRAAEVTPAVAKTSAGAIEHLRIYRVSSIPQTIVLIREAGLWAVGLAADATAMHTDIQYLGPTALVVGAEGSGLHRLARERCDQLVRLPMLGQVSSLNAAVAASVVMYEALRQRSAMA
jgi:23S rRNA (guanosine2251-2'-O)-methyltransferase